MIGGGASNMKFIREYNAAAQYIMDTNHWVDPKKAKTRQFVATLRRTTST